jgi:nitroreductase
VLGGKTMRNEFEKALHFRHACKVFDADKKIQKEDLNFILESARMSPSSFGMEAWKFLVIQDKELREELAETCWNPTKTKDCSELIVLLNQKKIRSNHPHVRNQFKPRGDDIRPYLKTYGDFIDSRSDEEINCWTGKQAYIASGFIMMSAASINIDSCPIEGFKKDEATKVLDIDTKNFEISYMIALGYRVNKQQQRFRRDFNDVIEFK